MKTDFEEKLGRKLRIYMNVAENSGVGYYREYLPAIALRETGLADVRINDFRWGEGDHVEPTEKVFYETCNWADVVVAGRNDLPRYYSKWGAVKEYFNVPIIMDTDDNIHNVRPSNPGYQGYYPGSEAQLWNDFAMQKIFDAITVTTTHLQNYYKKYHPRIYVLPNSLNFKLWDKYKRKKHDKIKIVFLCSGSHSEGFGIIMPAVHKILEKYPNTEFYYPDMYWRLVGVKEERKEQYKTLPWIKLKEWEKQVKEYSFDIGLAPLRDNLFNRSKSNLRYIEYAAAKTAPIISPVEPYLCVKDGENGLVAKETDVWYNKIEQLLDDEYRQKIAENAYSFAKTNFDVYFNAKLWYNVYTEIHDKFHAFYGKKKQFIEVGKGEYRELLGH